MTPDVLREGPMVASKTDIATAVRDGYAFDGPCVELGALVVDGTPRAEAKVRVPLAMLNRHGLVAGATGTGKTKTLQLMTEQLSTAGVPVFAADIKGDLTGLATPGEAGEKVSSRARGVGQDWMPKAYPVELLRLGEAGTGVPVRATVTSFGPTLLSKVLQLNDTQESSLGLVFHYADKAGLPLLDLKDLRAVIQHLTSDEGKADLQELGGLAKPTAGVILRELINFAESGADSFFGEPEFDVTDLMRSTDDGRGVVTLLELPGVQDRPVLFSTFLMWLLAELFEVLPEVGDVDKPKLVFFFDEAHLLFTDASRDFTDALIQTVRLIRSKGVGVFFVTQTPKDVHEDVLAQLGSRIQHQLRGFTPDDAAALKATVRTYPTSPYDLEELLTTVGIGEAVVTVMSEQGAPTPVAHTLLPAPQSLMAPSSAEILSAIVAASPLTRLYAEAVDRESASERLTGKIAAGPGDALAPRPADGMTEEQRLEAEILGGPPTPTLPPPEPARDRSRSRTRSVPSEGGGLVEQVLGSSAFEGFLKSAGATLAREISRGVFGNRRRR
ncbi:MAG TPA: helicase HerA-like domain-containing protein [Jiangellaceae bacterium]|nr:helicase HerA-like domain-containing protein [Jiangellaceae bacterium]